MFNLKLTEFKKEMIVGKSLLFGEFNDIVH